MGWSCTAAASDIMDALFDYCTASNGRSNEWIYRGNRYFAEVGKEHADGHISMTIYKMVSDTRCKTSGSIYIRPNGTIHRMPQYLKAAIAPFIKITYP